MVSKSRVFCPACGLQVEPALGFEGEFKTVSCSLCDLLLESRPDPTHEPPPIVTGRMVNAVAAIPALPPPMETVIAAEDTEGILKNLVALLSGRGLARNVVGASNGEEFLVHYHRAMAAGQVPSLLILDVNMPILNGINAAIAVRAAERASGATFASPILFFTSTLCDESFKRVLQFTAPARYLNKGAPGTPAEFAERLVQVLASLVAPAAGTALPTA